MEITTINAEVLAKMFMAGAKNLEAQKEWINELNVFPVPDGDTGTNMSMTIMSAAKEVASLEHPDMASLAKAVSSGSLRGARGNSGVILSQLLRGFTKIIAEYDTISVQILTDALQKATETAYKAVMKPKEGTILTVARGISEKALILNEETDDLIYFCGELIKEGDRVLLRTPDMLPVLKQAGVVDSGGQGLMQVLKGAYDSLCGKEIDITIEGVKEAGETSAEEKRTSYIDAQANQEITFVYCTQFLIMLKKPFTEKQEDEFKSYLETLGDSIVVVSDDEIVKVHVHTNDPGKAMQKALSYGGLTTIIIENMVLERDEKVSAMKEKEMQSVSTAKEEIKEAVESAEETAKEKEMGFISVSIGEGINEIFEGLGADYIIEGGQTMNPSTEDMLLAIEKVNARNVFILPNNKNIILAANQAAAMTEGKKVIVIPTKTIPQGITALINFIPDNTPEDNAARMEEEIGMVKTGQITYAVRDTVIEEKEIKQGDYMGIGDQGIVSVGKNLEETVLTMISELVDKDSAILTIYYGEEIAEDDAKVIANKAEQSYPEVEVELHYGGQPIYYYVVSVEA